MVIPEIVLVESAFVVSSVLNSLSKSELHHFNSHTLRHETTSTQNNYNNINFNININPIAHHLLCL